MKNIFLAVLLLGMTIIQAAAHGYQYWIGFSSLTKTTGGQTVKVDVPSVTFRYIMGGVTIENPYDLSILFQNIRDTECACPEWDEQYQRQNNTFYLLNLTSPKGTVIFESTLTYQEAVNMVKRSEKGGTPRQYSAQMRIVCKDGTRYTGLISYIVDAERVESKYRNLGAPEIRQKGSMTWPEFMCSFSSLVNKNEQEREDLHKRICNNAFTNNPVGNAVDLGLSVKWADRNLGDMDVAQGYVKVGWGDPTGLKFSKNNNDYPSPEPVPTSIEGSEYDIARAKWGGNWRLPTKAECEEFINKCKFEYDSKKHAIRAIGPNGNSIIMPLSEGKDYGAFWTGNRRESSNGAYYMIIEKPGSYAVSKVSDGNNRFVHVFVRPVLSK